MAAALLWILMLGQPAAEPAKVPASRLAVIRPAPDCTLLDQDGRKVRFASFKGKILLVGFIFTTCSGTCPATTHRLAAIQQRLDKLDPLRKKVLFLTISLDPVRDTPEVLRGYRRLYDLPEDRWTFLTGARGDVEAVHRAWGMWAKPAANGQLDHPSRVFLVDDQGRIREIYNLDFLRLPWVIEDLELLARE